MTTKEFNEIIKLYDKNNAKIVDDRYVRYISAYTALGENILRKCRTDLGEDLFDVYEHLSRDKYNSFQALKKRYSNETDAYNFRITGANGYRYSVAWCVRHIFEDGTDIEWVLFTKSNEYHVLQSRTILD